MIAFWYLWLLFMIFVVLPPIGYGWGYRGWGPPFPRVVQRRRGPRGPSMAQTAAAADHLSWGWFGDVVWLLLSIGVVWALWGLVWRTAST
jgi:hypothetical protein